VSTHTSTVTTTRTHTATWLAEIILGTIADIMADLGVDATRFFREWDQDEAAIKEWVLEGSLALVVLECHQPNGKVAPVLEFPVRYSATGQGDANFTAHRASIARFRAKLDLVPPGTTYAILCSFEGPHSAQPGWGPGTRASTADLRATALGTIATAPDASASMRYLR
jgi:hypothetical protein